MRKALLVAAPLLAMLSVVASAQTGTIWATGNFMKKVCHSETRQDQGRCEGFAMGVAGVMASAPVAEWRACIPVGVLVAQLTTIMLEHLDDHPEKLHNDAIDLTAQAFAIAFPCPK